MWRSRKGHEPTAPQLSLLEYFTRVPTYQKLFAAFPAITVTAGPVRDISLIPDPGEDLRFLSNLQQRTSVSYLMTAEEVSRSGIPHSLLFSYSEIVSDLIQREVGTFVTIRRSSPVSPRYCCPAGHGSLMFRCWHRMLANGLIQSHRNCAGN